MLSAMSPPAAESPVQLPSPVDAPDRGRELRRNLAAITGDGFAFSIMVGAGESYLAAFALALGKSELVCGLITTVPMLSGALLQLVSPLAVRLLNSHRRWVVLCAILQALSFVPLVVGALAGAIPTAALFLVASVYWGAGLGTGPAWNTWVETLVPQNIRPRFFACRTRMAQAGILVGLIGGGIALQTGRSSGVEMRVFAGLFVVSCLARVVSALFLASQTEKRPSRRAASSAPEEPVRRQTTARLRRRRRLLLYLLMMQGSVQISGPFFAPYMLRHLEQSYAVFVALIAAAFAARIVVLPALGRFAQRWGTGRLLWLGAIGITPLPALWLISSNFWFLLAVQVLGGAVWAAHELAMLLMFFDSIPRSERTSVLSRFNFANAAAMASGTLIGAAILGSLHETREAYLLLFGLSSAFRVLSMTVLGRVPRRVTVTFPLALRTLAVRPSAGSLDRPVLAGFDPPAHVPVPVGAARD